MASHARRLAAQLVLATLSLPGLALAETTLPQRDLIVELREAVADGAATGWDLNSADDAHDRAVQKLRVRNGRSATLSLAVTRPVQTWQVLPGVWRGVVAPAMQWISAGQSLDVEPRWPGGARAVAVKLRATASHFDPTVAAGSASPPERRAAALETSVEVALGDWVVIATSGNAAAAPGNAISTRDAVSHALQLRVSLAP